MKKLELEDIVYEAVSTYLKGNLEEDRPFKAYRDNRCLYSGQGMVYHNGKLFWYNQNTHAAHMIPKKERIDFNLIGNDTYVDYINVGTEPLITGEFRKKLEACLILGYDKIKCKTCCYSSSLPSQSSNYYLEYVCSKNFGYCNEISFRCDDEVPYLPTYDIKELLEMTQQSEIIYIDSEEDN